MFSNNANDLQTTVATPLMQISRSTEPAATTKTNEGQRKNTNNSPKHTVIFLLFLSHVSLDRFLCLLPVLSGTVQRCHFDSLADTLMDERIAARAGSQLLKQFLSSTLSCLSFTPPAKLCCGSKRDFKWNILHQCNPMCLRFWFWGKRSGQPIRNHVIVFVSCSFLRVPPAVGFSSFRVVLHK